MTDAEIRTLCNRFFDAYQDRRVEELAELYAPDCIVWHNVFGREQSVDALHSLLVSADILRNTARVTSHLHEFRRR